MRPALELDGALTEVLDDGGARGVSQAMVEVGASVDGQFHREGLVDRYVLYLAPALFGGDDARGLFAGPGSATIDDVWRGEVRSVRQVGADVRLELAPQRPLREEVN